MARLPSCRSGASAHPEPLANLLVDLNDARHSESNGETKRDEVIDRSALIRVPLYC
jgi:hypothetical protein